MKKFFKGFVYAYKGIAYAVRTQINFQFHLAAALVVILMGIFFKLTIGEWMWISLCIGLVLIFELINTALEAFVDLVSPEYNPKAGIVKDVAAAAVMVSALLAIAISLFIFLPKVLNLLIF